MGADNLLLKLSTRGVQFGLPGGGVAELSREDVAAALRLPRVLDDGTTRKLHRLAELWACRVVLNDVSGHDELIAGLARQVNPQREKARKHAVGLAKLAIVLRRRPTHCKACNGQRPKCKVCHGSGLRPGLPVARMADYVQIPETSFRRHQGELMGEVGFLYDTLGTWEQWVASHLAWHCYEQRAA